MAKLIWPESGALLCRHPQTEFGGKDEIEIPPQRAAILVCGGIYSPVYREGETPSLGHGFLRRKGELFLIRMDVTAPLEWGCPDLHCGRRTGGCHGIIRFRVVSPERFLTAYGSAELPLTEDALLDDWIPGLQESLRRQAQILGKEGDRQASELVELLSPAFLEDCSDRLEAKGLTVEELTVEDVFFPD